MNPILIVGAVGGLFWIVVYLLIIRRSFIDHTYGVPVISLCANTSWEFTYTFVLPQGDAQQIANFVWFVLDLILLYTYVRFGRRESNLTRFGFNAVFGVTLICAFVLIITTALEFGDWQGKYAAFVIDFMMSVLFIHLLLKRGGIAGQSYYIAQLKWLGSACYAVVFYYYFPGSWLLLALFVLTFLFNLVYTVLIYRQVREAGINPLRRF